MRVLGIDPGTWKVGLGIVLQEKGKLSALHHETLVLQKSEGHVSLAKRLKKLYDSLTETLKIYRPDVVALEDIFYALNFQTAVRIGEARAVAMLAAADFDMEVVEYSPARVKKALTGNGQASKVQMQFMVRQLLRLEATPSSDAADALAVAICHCHRVRQPTQASLKNKRFSGLLLQGENV